MHDQTHIQDKSEIQCIQDNDKFALELKINFIMTKLRIITPELYASS